MGVEGDGSGMMDNMHRSTVHLFENFQPQDQSAQIIFILERGSPYDLGGGIVDRSTF